MLKAYKYRLYPNEEQKIQISKTFGCVRFVYNYYLAKKIELYKTEQKHMSKIDCNNHCNKELKNEFVWFKEVDKFALTNAIYNLDNAFQKFFKEHSGFPKLKSKKSHKYSYTTNFTNNNIEVDFDNYQYKEGREMENNKALVCRLKNIRPIEGADNIVCADVAFLDTPIATVVTKKEAKEDQKVLFFDANLALTDSFISSIDKLSPDYGKEGFKGIATYLGKGNRVRAIRLKKALSAGLVLNAEEVEKAIGKPVPPEGTGLTEIEGIPICYKWVPAKEQVTKTTLKQKKLKKKIKKMNIMENQFRFYVDTPQLLLNLSKISPFSVASISRKIHGTSAIASRILVKRKLSLIEKILKYFKIPIQESEYAYVYASRNVIKSDDSKNYYEKDIWTFAGKKFFEGKLHTGETVYYEIYGYVPGTKSMIQKDYDYGVLPGEFNIAVYRITNTAPDGSFISLDWASMEQRCKELQVPMVQTYWYGRLCDLFDIPVDKDWHKNFVEKLKETFLEKDIMENLCKKNVPDEGIVLRVEGLGIDVYKLKSNRFLVKESSLRDEGATDLESEQASL